MNIKDLLKFNFIDSSSIIHRTSVVKRFCKLRNTKVGEYSYIANNSHVINTNIGKYCSIGPFVKIGLGKHPTNRFSTSPIFYSGNNVFKLKIVHGQDFEEYDDIQIGNDVWVGANAIILDGVKIGNGAIIAAGAVVTKNVPSYAIVAGVPAKVIKYRFLEEIRNQLEESNWWDIELELLKENKKNFDNVNSFIKGMREIKRNSKVDKEEYNEI